MKALLPVYCRPLGYVVLLVALFIPFILVMQGVVTDTNLLFYKECTKLLMMAGCLLIIFALSKNESRETEQIRNSAVRNAIFLTFLFAAFVNFIQMSVLAFVRLFVISHARNDVAVYPDALPLIVAE